MKLLLSQEELSQGNKNRILKEFARLSEPKAPYAGMSRYFLTTWEILTGA